MNKQEKLIFLGIIIISAGILLKILSGLLTFIIIVIGIYFVVKGIIKLDKSKRSNKKKKKR